MAVGILEREAVLKREGPAQQGPVVACQKCAPLLNGIWERVSMAVGVIFIRLSMDSWGSYQVDGRDFGAW